MASPRELKFPPITEALIDIRAAVTAPLDLFEEAARALKAEFPKESIRRAMRAEFRVEAGKLIPPTSEDLGFQGVLLHNEAGTEIVQFRPDGFSLNNLTSTWAMTG